MPDGFGTLARRRFGLLRQPALKALGRLASSRRYRRRQPALKALDPLAVAGLDILVRVVVLPAVAPLGAHSDRASPATPRSARARLALSVHRKTHSVRLPSPDSLRSSGRQEPRPPRTAPQTATRLPNRLRCLRATRESPAWPEGPSVPRCSLRCHRKSKIFEITRELRSLERRSSSTVRASSDEPSLAGSRRPRAASVARMKARSSARHSIPPTGCNPAYSAPIRALADGPTVVPPRRRARPEQ